MKTTILTLLIAITLFSGCEKSSTITIIEDGSYSGTLTIKNDINTYSETIPVTLSLEQGKFLISLSSNAKPTGGNGTFAIKDGVATFDDRNVWTADFDWSRILNGDYDLEFGTGKLVLTKRLTPTHDAGPATHYTQISYQYVLTRDK